jgi:hypothetical protein
MSKHGNPLKEKSASTNSLEMHEHIIRHGVSDAQEKKWTTYNCGIEHRQQPR